MSLVIETNVTPPLEWDPAAQEEPSAVLAWLRPRIAGDLAGLPVRWAPWGDPVPGLGVLVFWGVLGLAAYGAWRLLGR